MRNKQIIIALAVTSVVLLFAIIFPDISPLLMKKIEAFQASGPQIILITTSIMLLLIGFGVIWIRNNLINQSVSQQKQFERTKLCQLFYLEELQQDNWFHHLLSEMVLNLQGCFSRKEIYLALSGFLSRFFPNDSGVFLVRDAQGIIGPVAAWGQYHPAGSLLFHECLALWHWRAHCGPQCGGSFGCKQLSNRKEDRICIPLGMESEFLGMLHILVNPDDNLGGTLTIQKKKKWATILAEHLSLILVNSKVTEDLCNLSLRDSLTGLFNRRFLEESLKRELCIAARQGRPLAVLMLDLDHFKQFNDTYGHQAGDALLKELGQFLQQHIRAGDIVCRYGGEEFTIILAEANKDNVLKRAEELRTAIPNLRVWHLQQYLRALTISVGVAVYPEHGSTKDALLEAADAALYRAKEIGRNRVCLADGELVQEGELTLRQQEANKAPSHFITSGTFNS